MKKLWEKGHPINKKVEKFSVGKDIHWDQCLIFYDCLGSIAHAAMLKKIDLLTPTEFNHLHTGLWKTIHLHEKGLFSLSVEDEDVHTAVENYLTHHYGSVGKKLHSARSRNDQIAVDLRLYVKHQLIQLGKALLPLCKVLYDFAINYQKVPIPGRTHMQRAMPSSLGLWAGAFLESLLDNFLALKQAYTWNDQCPLGSAAGYGSALAIDRQYTADLLGFAKVQNNVLYVSNSRGKFEASALHVAAQIMTDLSRMANDLTLFITSEFGYVSFPKEYCLGSSLMPQKHNPCVLELIRAKAVGTINALSTSLGIIRSLPSGYSRDLQETKEPLMQGLATTQSSLEMMTCFIQKMHVHEETCIAAFTNEIFATDAALALVKNGVPFREAYRQVAADIDKVGYEDPLENIMNKTHLGSTGNLGLSKAQSETHHWEKWLLEEQNKWEATVDHLANITQEGLK